MDTQNLAVLAHKQQKRLCVSIAQPQLIHLFEVKMFFLCSGAGRLAFGGSGGSEVAVQRGIRSVENEVAIMAFRQVPLDLALDRWGQLSL